jgi:hypothetical protein
MLYKATLLLLLRSSSETTVALRVVGGDETSTQCLGV